jgi:hypothetical protein
VWAWSERLDELAQHDVNIFVAQSIAEGRTEACTMAFQVGRRRQALVVEG